MVKPRIRALSFAVTASALSLVYPALAQPSQNTPPLPSLPPSAPTQAQAPPPPVYAPPPESLPDLPPTPNQPSQSAPPAPRNEERGEDVPPPASKRFSVGGDLMLMFPVGNFGKATGVLLGPVAQVGYRVTPHVDLSFRVGVLFGFNHAHTLDDGNTYSTSQSIIPIWLGARYFFADDGTGLYARGEIGLNLLQLHFHDLMNDPLFAGDQDENVQARAGFNVGVGYVLSKKLPIDFHVQFTYLNLLFTQTNATNGLTEDPFLGIAIGVGYTLSF